MAGFLGNFQGTYDPSKFIITIDGVTLHGFIDGDFFSAKYDEDRYTKVKGVDGEVTRIRTLSTSGTMEFTLAATSNANDELNSFNPDYGYIGVAPISIADLSGRSFINAEKSWLKSSPEIVNGKEVGERKWVFDCAQMEMFVGGAKNNSVFDMIFG